MTPESLIHAEVPGTPLLIPPLRYDRPALQLLLYEPPQPFATVLVVRHMPLGVRKTFPGLGGYRARATAMIDMRAMMATAP